MERENARKLWSCVLSDSSVVFSFVLFQHADMLSVAIGSTTRVMSTTSVPMPAPVIATPAVPLPVLVSLSAAISSPSTAQQAATRASRRQRMAL